MEKITSNTLNEDSKKLVITYMLLRSHASELELFVSKKKKNLQQGKLNWD